MIRLVFLRLCFYINISPNKVWLRIAITILQYFCMQKENLIKQRFFSPSSLMLEWVTIPFFRRLSQPRDRTEVSCMANGFLVAQTVKNPPAMHETWVHSLGLEYALEKGMATHSSILAWRISWTEEPGGLQSMGSQRVGQGWVTNTFSFHFLYRHGYQGMPSSFPYYLKFRYYALHICFLMNKAAYIFMTMNVNNLSWLWFKI